MFSTAVVKDNLEFSLRLIAVATYVYMYYFKRYSKGVPETES